MTVREGGCLCEAVRFAVAGPPKYTFHCHCFSCRRHAGAAVATFAGLRVNGVFRWTKGTPAVYGSSPGVTRKFCGRCSTPLTYEAERLPDEVHVAIGAFDEQEWLPPAFHVHVAERIPWFDTADHLPRFARGSEGAESA